MNAELWVNVIAFIGMPAVTGILGLVLRGFGKLKDRCEKINKDCGDSIAALQKENADLRLHIAENYLKKNDFKEVLSELKDTIQHGLQEQNQKIEALFTKFDGIIQLALEKKKDAL